MMLLEALEKGHKVLITFVDIKRNAQWSIVFVRPSEFVQFINPMIGALEQAPVEEERPFDFFKLIFVSEEPPENEDEDEWDNDLPCGQA